MTPGSDDLGVAQTGAAWFVYIVECRDGSLYTGIAKDVAARIAQHNGGRGGARYTRGRGPVRLVYCEPAASRSAASRREAAIKRMPRAAKLSLATASAGPREHDGKHSR